MHDKFDINTAALRLLTYVENSLTNSAMETLTDQVAHLCNAYNNVPSLRIQSKIDFSQLDAFKHWLPEALEKKSTVIPYLISTMLEGNIMTLSIFNALYKAAGKDNMVIDYIKIISDPELSKIFNEYGGDEQARDILTAEHWLESIEAAEIFTNHDNQDVLCSTNTILHITNENIDCNMSQ